MSINRPDGKFTVEFLLKENADLKEQNKRADAIWVGLDAKNDRLALMYSMAQREIADLKKQLADLKEVCSRLEDEKEIILKHVPDTHLRVAVEELVAHSEAFTAAEYFAGR
jgi:hypothetical protein